MAKTAGYVYYKINSDAVKALAIQYINSLSDVHKYNEQIIKDLGVKRGIKKDSNIAGVVFDGPVHPEFTAADKKGISYPKKNTDWKVRFDSAPKVLDAGRLIESHLGFDFSFDYKSESENVSGSEYIGGINFILNPGGFLHLPHSDIYGLYIIDINHFKEAFIERMARDYPNEIIYLTNEKLAQFDMTIPGTERMSDKDWMSLVREERRLTPLKVK